MRYVAFWAGKRIEGEASDLHEAQEAATEVFQSETRKHVKRNDVKVMAARRTAPVRHAPGHAFSYA